MQLKMIILSEVRKTNNITYSWNLKYTRDEHIYKRGQTHRHREQTCGCQGEVSREGEEYTGSSGLVDPKYYNKQQGLNA